MRSAAGSACLFVLVFLVAPCTHAVEESPDLFRFYHFLDLAECLEQYKEREFFEVMHGRAHVDKTAETMFMVGLLHQYGLGTPRNTDEAVRWYRKAAAAGYTFEKLGNEASRGLEEIAASSPSIPEPDPALLRLAEQALEQGAEDQLRLGTRYWRGLCAPLDWEEAMRWEILAAENGSDEARRIVVESFSLGANAYPRDHGKALPWLDSLADSGDTVAMVALGDIYLAGSYRPRDAVKALAWYERAAEADDLTAWWRLYTMHSQGVGVEPDEKKLEIIREKLNIGRRLPRPSEQNRPRPVAEYADEIYHQALKHYRGDGVPADIFKAAMLFADAAGLGAEDPDNHYHLGWIQENGLAGVPNPYGAGKSYRIAALLGHGEAMLRLGGLHEEGRGVRFSLRQAERWYAVAAEKAVEGAEERLRRARERLAQGEGGEWAESEEGGKVLEDARYRATFRFW